MQVFDASSMIYAWDNYPLRQFPALWEWIANQVQASELAMPRVALEEVEDKAPDCGEWLKLNQVERLEISDEILQEAVRIKELLRIVDDKYHAKGVGENDILIIATASVHRVELVSNEGRQKAPEIPAKSKIPAVCSMQDVSVPCINFLEFITRSGAVF